MAKVSKTVITVFILKSAHSSVSAHLGDTCNYIQIFIWKALYIIEYTVRNLVLQLCLQRSRAHPAISHSSHLLLKM